MSYKKVEKEECFGYTDTLDFLVVALCRDYARREGSVNEKRCTPRTEMEYRYINYRIIEATEEIVGVKYARLFIDEIGNKVGYAYSSVDCMSECMYKIKKKEVKVNIAKSLHLLD